MKLATLRTTPTSTVAVRVDADTAVEIDGFTDVGALLADPTWRQIAEAATGTAHPLDQVNDEQWAPVVSAPSKIVCVGLNYRNHILEMGRELPEHPTLFAKYPEALIGPYDPIVLPEYASHAVDWEAELAVVIGQRARRLTATEASDAIAGYSVLNDVTMRDFQYRTPEWFQGKTFEATTPFGPVLVTPDEYAVDTDIRTEVDGETMQHSNTDDLVFDPAALVAYISQIVALNPGDVIASGTPGGVGHACKPARYLTDGATLVTSIEGIGTLRNPVRAEA
ncbi:fumarylacetoacetate hydrolase family protein [Herbiconiux sp. KACC 21604]|uniref:fumarylacetoacetate hydrolase family protein n=1 Tax=unclassified Herbiconiux TaxID=2618217 RepID=UPI001492D72C|nr:fumarylacetoacetate hydrolase family protein [Herbiconiux sp. SALV-R1]QJU55325.1 fumarylacetoacetate hydrolase family protein [Herbiconiux sp. SALV-R1]WPO86493.1 fumarylacetoacetate hydrolase family protein [Herbiconiux sp. KACC 21604]